MGGGIHLISWLQYFIYFFTTGLPKCLNSLESHIGFCELCEQVGKIIARCYLSNRQLIKFLTTTQVDKTLAEAAGNHFNYFTTGQFSQCPPVGFL